MSSPLSILNLPPREEELLRRMGYDTLEKIAAAPYGGKLGLGKRRGEAILERARRILAKESIKSVTITENSVEIQLAGASKGIITSIERILRPDTLKRELRGSSLIIHRAKPEPCALCGGSPQAWCTACGRYLCQECKSKHYEHYYSLKSLEELELEFERVSDEARAWTPQPTTPEPEAPPPNEDLVEYARRLGLAGFAEAFFAELEGNEVMKRALACALFSTPEEPIHVLVVGEPAGGKTMARDIIARRLGEEVELVGASATRAGLVCNLATGELGVLAYSDGKIVLADEFDKIPEQDVQYCYELLSNGKCSVHSARVHETIESRFILVAFANPTGAVFGRETLSGVPVPPILASRFAFIVRAEELDPRLVRGIIRRKLLGEEAVGEEFSKYCQPWLRAARMHRPKLKASEEAIEAYVERVSDIYERFRKTPLRRDLRMADYARRIPLAIARARFTDIDKETLEEAAGLIEESLDSWK